jgi:hypothetical protein
VSIVLKAVLGAAAMGPLLYLLASGRDPPRPAPAAAVSTLAERWPANMPQATKADRLAFLPAPLTATPRDELSRPPEPPAAEPPPAPKRAADIRQAHAERRHHRESNICTRHGMHKVITRSGRSWRCRR